MEKQEARAGDSVPISFPTAPVIQFGIFCCVVTMVIVLAVAIAAQG